MQNSSPLGLLYLYLLAKAMWLLIKIGLIIGGVVTLVGARQAASWDPGVVRMSIGSGLFCILLGLFMLFTGCPM
jgi:hypothetical protein